MLRTNSIIVIVALTACGEDPTTLVQSEAVVAPSIEAVWSGSGEVALIGDSRILISAEEGVLLGDPRRAIPEDLGIDPAPLVGGAWVGPDLIVATDHAVHLWNGARWDSPLANALTGAPQALTGESDRATLWLRDDGGWLRWQRSSSARINLDGAPANGPIALGGQVAGQGASWVSRGGDEGVVAALAADNTVLESETFDDVRSMTATSDGRLWLADGRYLQVRDAAGVWTEFRFDSAVSDVWGHPATPNVFIRTVDGDFFGDIEGVAPIDLPDGMVIGADHRDRLYGKNGDGTWAASPSPTVALLDLPAAPLDVPTTVTVDPPDRTQVTAVMINVDGEATALDPAPPWRFQVRPDTLEPGPHTFQATVSWSGGRTEQVERPFEIAQRIVTWDEDVQILFEDRCAQCHGGSSETVLETPDAWVLQFDRILELVEGGQMPLSQRALDDDELGLLRAWRTGGFQ